MTGRRALEMVSPVLSPKINQRIPWEYRAAIIMLDSGKGASRSGINSLPERPQTRPLVLRRSRGDCLRKGDDPIVL
eukprot:10658487-Prorocentrum_lima.AAC.1